MSKEKLLHIELFENLNKGQPKGEVKGWITNLRGMLEVQVISTMMAYPTSLQGAVARAKIFGLIPDEKGLQRIEEWKANQ